MRRPGVRAGYDLWAPTYDATPNPLVELDRRTTFDVLSPEKGEIILDAGCGTGYYLPRLLSAGAQGVGMDLSLGMLFRSRSAHPAVPLVQADLHSTFPFRDSSFHAVLSVLVSEHIRDIGAFCREVARVLRPGGRFVWSVFHPGLAHAGTEANFPDDNGNEIRLGAEQHTVSDYEQSLDGAGFIVAEVLELKGDEKLAKKVPRAQKYVGTPMLLVYEAARK